MNFKQMFEDLCQNHRGKTVGLAVGLLIGICIMLFGLFQMLFILLCGAAGLFIGKKIDDKQDIFAFLVSLLPPGLRR